MTAAVVSDRLEEALRHALGPDVARLLGDDATTDVMLNADGRIVVDQLRTGRVVTPHILSTADAMAALRLLADFSGEILTRETPILSAEIPGSGERVAGTIPPVTKAPTFAIRKPPREVFALEAFEGDPMDVVSQDTLDDTDSGTIAILRRAVAERQSVMICGATGSGKTSLASALLSLPSIRDDRLVICEDRYDLVTSAPDAVRFLARERAPEITMRDLVRLALRYRPDRILVGELRDGGTTMAYLGALNTGHRGGICTLHANSAADAMARLEALCAEVCTTIPTQQIRSAIDIVVFVIKTRTGRAIQEIWKPADR